MKKKIISILKDEFAKEIIIYHTNIKTKNYLHAAENVHKLKHKISILGLEKSYQIAIRHENYFKRK